MVSYLVTKLFQSESQKILHLVDFLAPNNDDMYSTILGFLVNTAKSNDRNVISMFLNKYQPFSEYLKKHGFKYAKTNRVYIIRANNNVLDKDILFEEKNHYMTMGDSDVI